MASRRGAGLSVAGVWLIVAGGWVAGGDRAGADEAPRSARPLAIVDEAVAGRGAEPRSLAAADFDSDGIADLAAGYATAEGGVLLLARGNPDAIYPNAPEARARRAAGAALDAPFHPAREGVALPFAPDFLLAGDFDADGHKDLAAFARGGDLAGLARGDGAGGLALVGVLPLPGRVTAALAADVDRRDGLADVVLALETEAGPALLVAAGPQGAVRPFAELLALPAPARALAAGYFDDDPWVDVAAGAGAELLVVRGRDRRLSLSEAERAAVPPARIDRAPLPVEALALAAGGFGGGLHDLALLGADGRVATLAHADLAGMTPEGRALPVRAESERLAVGAGALLLPARLGTAAADALVLVDPSGSGEGALRRVSDGGAGAGSASGPEALAVGSLTGVGSVTDAAAALAEPVAALALRLDSDGLSDLVLLSRESGRAVLVPSAPVAIFTVNSTNDANDGTCNGTHCSLREAINAANGSAGADAISFAGLAPGAHTIAPSTDLPALTQTVTIDGTTHPDGRVEIDGTGTSFALQVASAPSSVMRGLVLNRASTYGLAVTGASAGALIEGNVVGLDFAASVAAPNGSVGVFANSGPLTIGGAAPAARNVIAGGGAGAVYLQAVGGLVVRGNLVGTDGLGASDRNTGGNGIYVYCSVSPTVGGAGAGEGNLVSGSDGPGIHLDGCSGGALVQGNRLGTDASGTAAIPNTGEGIRVSYQPNATIGGTAPGAGNLISGNAASGIWFPGSTGGSVQGNLIGTQADAVSPLPNTVGVSLDGGTAVGGVAPGAGNVIAHNSGYGVGMGAGVGSIVRGNTMFANGGLGIDIQGNGRTPNDATDSDAGVNLRQNFPVLAAVSIDGFGDLQIAYSVDSDPGYQAYPLTVDFYAADLLGQGESWIGSDSYSTVDHTAGVKTVNLGNAAGLGVASTQPIVAVASDAANNSSEFSDGKLVDVAGATTFTVNAADDTNDGLCDGTHCSLREAILFANLNGGAADTIAFAIPGSPPFTIAPLAALPKLVDPVTVDATTQAGYAGTPVVELAGHLAGSVNGLWAYNTTGVAIRGLAVNRFPAAGIRIEGTTNAEIRGCYVGTDLAGTAAQANGNWGIWVGPGSDNATIGGALPGEGNLVSGNSGHGLEIQSVAGLQVQGNRIGTNAAGTAVLANGSGVAVFGSVPGTIGGPSPGEGNLISGNYYGVFLSGASGVALLGNWIGTDATGLVPLGNQIGIYVYSGSANTIGGAAPGEGNLVSGNTQLGVNWSNGSGGAVRGNRIGVGSDGLTPVPNGRGILVQQSFGIAIGGTLPGEGNLVARNNSEGLLLNNGGTGNAIRRNSFHDNGSLGIDLEWNGATPNDPGDGDGGTNRRQNYPDFQSVAIDGLGDLQVTYRVDSTPANAAYPIAVELFKPDSAASREGKTHVATDTYTAADQLAGWKTVNLGNAAGLGLAVGSRLVGTATDANGNSSEFSLAQGVTGAPQVFVVNTATDGDDGACDVAHCSLREALDASNSNTPALDTIHFAIPGGPPHVIQPGSALPPIAEPVTLDATTQTGYAGVPLVELSGASTCCDGLVVTGGAGTSIRGFVVRNWPGTGIAVQAPGTTVAGNWIGTDASGLAAAPNSTGLSAGGAGTLVGGPAPADRNLISGNGSTGLSLVSGATALGNWIGVDATGGGALGNLTGVVLQDATLGGAAPGEGNLIAGNAQRGVEVYGSTSTLRGNRIGTNAAGSAAVPNGGDGIYVLAAGGAIGGLAPGEGNLVSGNLGAGLRIDGSSNVDVQGNRIGLDAAGVADLGNGQEGVHVLQSAGTLLEANVVSGNGRGVRIEGGSSGTLLFANRIGTDAAGAAAVGNSGVGVEVIDSSGTQIGAAGQGNLISGNLGRGVRISGAASAGALVRGNAIGTDLAGNADLGNSSDGIEVVDVANVAIGGAAPGEGNLVSGNGLRGIVLSGSSTIGAQVMGNRIGTNAAGTAALGNAGAGVEIGAAPGNFVGGPGAGQRNLISGNGSIGVYVNGSNATGNVISGNYIGTDGTGTAALGNGSSGVDVSAAPANLVGGAAPGAGNLISGNGGIGVSISFSGSTANLVQGNRIGTDVTASAAIPNAADGVQIFAAPGNTIGGTAVGAGNVISGNTLSGIALVFSGAAGNFVHGNLIGTEGDGFTPLGNGLAGVSIGFNASSNRIGGTAPGEGNVIAGNLGDGIAVDSGVNDRLSGNSYFDNGGLAIDLGADGVQANDPLDADAGANGLQNFPAVDGATSDGATTVSIWGTLASAPSTAYTVELYASPACDPSGHGEGGAFLGTAAVITDGAGQGSYSVTLPVGVADGAAVVALARTSAGNTSELGPCTAESDALFSDDFESGDDSAWDLSFP